MFAQIIGASDLRRTEFFADATMQQVVAKFERNECSTRRICEWRVVCCRVSCTPCNVVLSGLSRHTYIYVLKVLYAVCVLCIIMPVPLLSRKRENVDGATAIDTAVTNWNVRHNLPGNMCHVTQQNTHCAHRRW